MYNPLDGTFAPMHDYPQHFVNMTKYPAIAQDSRCMCAARIVGKVAYNY